MVSTAANSHASVKISNLHKAYGKVEVLKGINMDVEPGQVVCLIGPSGSGKSTLLRCVNLLEEPQQGSIMVAGHDVTDADVDINEVRRTVGMVFQQFNLFPHLSVLDNCTVAQVKVLKRGKAEAKKVALEQLEKVGLADKAERYPDQLSGGQQQRVAIARALAVEPDYLLFDEPTSALDPELEAEVIRVLIDLAREKRSMVVVTHNMAFAQKVADRIVFLDGGTVRYNGSSEGFFASEDERVRKFLNIYEVIS